MFPGNAKGWDLSFWAASKLKTGSPLVWQETFETIAKTSVSFSLSTKGILRDRPRLTTRSIHSSFSFSPMGVSVEVPKLVLRGSDQRRLSYRDSSVRGEKRANEGRQHKQVRPKKVLRI